MTIVLLEVFSRNCVQMRNKYDIIGDIHGHARALRNLLGDMGSLADESAEILSNRTETYSHLRFDLLWR
jgi:hypothetical protein